MKNVKKHSMLATLLLCAMACENEVTVQEQQPVDDRAIYRDFPSPRGAVATRTANGNYAVYSAEYLTSDESGQVGKTVFFRDVGNKQLDADFVPGLSLDGNNAISYYIDESRPSADLSVEATTLAIERAMNTWDDVSCSDLDMFRVPSSTTVQTGFISSLLGFGGSLQYVADVVHAGWLPGSFFDLIAPEGSTYILGVTFTIIFTDDNGNAVDTNNDKKIDVAWREIYYNDAFRWRIGATYDVETIALHEAGHGLSQDHFGKAFFDNGKGKLHFSPRAVMNAAYSGVQTDIGKTDNGGHCSIWANWPNN